MEFFKATGFTKYAYEYLFEDEVAMIPGHVLLCEAEEGPD